MSSLSVSVTLSIQSACTWWPAPNRLFHSVTGLVRKTGLYKSHQLTALATHQTAPSLNSLWSRKIQPLILRCSAVFIKEVEAMLLSHFVEIRLVVSGSQPFSKALPDWREPIVGFITCGPESITSYILRDLDNLQYSVVGGDTLKSDAFFCYWKRKGYETRAAYSACQPSLASSPPKDFP